MKPALTREEWEIALERMKTHDRLDVVWYESKSHHSCAALCLFEQPFGFTWEDVERLRRAIIIESYRFCDEPAEVDDLETQSLGFLADRIEALLPPEPQETPQKGG